MLMEGTGKYFLWLFLIFLIVYIAVKISLAVLLTRAATGFDIDPLAVILAKINWIITVRDI